jgi:DNA-binding NtrC family response regulator
VNRNSASILIVDDDEDLCLLLSLLMKQEGFSSRLAHSGEQAMDLAQNRLPDVLLLDVMMPGLNGMEVLRQVRNLDPDLPVILISAQADISGSVAAIKAGAFDYLAKPFDNRKVLRTLRRALRERDQKQQVMAGKISRCSALREQMGPSDAVTRIICEVLRVAKSNFTVIIQGETGSGKELVARAIHEQSIRSKAQFVPVDCGAIPETLIESELFGYQKGAFTGADHPKAGKFEAARGGTLFLDEIANLPLPSQAKLLRTLQDHAICRLGASTPTPIDVRLLVAANQDLQILVESDLMRRDLFFRLNEFTITVSPLRERKDDIPYLAKRFLDITNRELHKNVGKFTDAALEVLFSYNWPGNVRQLRAVIRRAVLLADDIITERHLDIKRAPVPGLAFTPRVQGAPWQDLPLKEIVRRSVISVEREILSQVLRYTHGNKAKAARLLQIDYKTIQTKVKQFGIKNQGGEYD